MAMSKSKSSTPTRQKYSREFRNSAVKMVVEENLDLKEVATRLGVELVNLRRWVSMGTAEKASQDKNSMKELLITNKKQEEEIRRLKMEREILKKAMAYFVPNPS